MSCSRMVLKSADDFVLMRARTVRSGLVDIGSSAVTQVITKCDEQGGFDARSIAEAAPASD